MGSIVHVEFGDVRGLVGIFVRGLENRAVYDARTDLVKETLGLVDVRRRYA